MIKEIDELNQKNNELENKHDMPDTESSEEQIQNNMQESKKSLLNKQGKKSSKAQKK